MLDRRTDPQSMRPRTKGVPASRRRLILTSSPSDQRINQPWCILTFGIASGLHSRSEISPRNGVVQAKSKHQSQIGSPPYSGEVWREGTYGMICCNASIRNDQVPHCAYDEVSVRDRSAERVPGGNGSQKEDVFHRCVQGSPLRIDQRGRQCVRGPTPRVCQTWHVWQA